MGNSLILSGIWGKIGGRLLIVVIYIKIEILKIFDIIY